MSNSLICYEVWDDLPPSIPPRSRLYSLRPIGVGTPLVESLTSYICRLAEAHLLSVWDLIKHEIKPQMKAGQGQRGITQEGQVINGYKPAANSWREAVETLTLQPNLYPLTLLPWAEVLAKGKTPLLSRRRKWCPKCYDAWKQASAPLYDPLPWSIDQVRLCPTHDFLLEDHCPYPDCGRSSSLLTARMRPGYCAWCMRWLGMPKDPEFPNWSDEEWAQQRWVVYVVGDLLATTLPIGEFPKQAKVTQTLQALTQQLTGGNVERMERLIQLPQLTLRSRLKANALLSFPMLLRICQALGITPSQFFTQEISLANPQVIARTLESNLQRGKEKSTTTARESFGEDLDRYLTSNEQPPISAKETARRLGCTYDKLKRLYPEQCAQITKRFRFYARERSGAREQKLIEEVEQATRELHKQGTYPTARLVMQALSSPGDFRRAIAMETWTKTKRDLGLEE